MIKPIKLLFLTLLSLMMAVLSSNATTPVYCGRIHNIGQLNFSLTNFGTFGPPPFRDCFSNQRVPHTEFPKNSNTVFLYRAGLWVGAVVGRDTLVSTAAEANIPAREFNPDVPPFGDIIYRTNTDPNSPGYDLAVSEQDFIAKYTDTFTTDVPDLSRDQIDLRAHKPLGVEITQSSYAWSFDYTKDFVLINYTVKNIGKEFLKDLYVGLYMDPDVHEAGVNANLQNPAPDLPIKPPTEGIDDLIGFFGKKKWELGECEIDYNLNLVWAADNDGDLEGSNWLARNVIGLRYLRTPDEFEQLSFNWWIFNTNPRYDFGPQHRTNFRFLGNGYGTPIGDRNKYFLMRNGEQDYDQAYASSISPYNFTWIQPNPNWSRIFSSANDIQFVLAAGPYDLPPGGEVSFPVGYVGGEDLHSNPHSWKRFLAANNDPETYYSNLDFSDLIGNAIWAGWVYDNPGVDTDNDGYFGKFAMCVLDSVLVDSVDSIWEPSVVETTYFEGDGVADFRGAAPPPAPTVWLEQSIRGLRVRFNGQRSETSRDIFSGINDFEGYNVYVARDNREQSYSLVATYDRENYEKYIFNEDRQPAPGFEKEIRIPYTLNELRCLYGSGPDPCNDSSFDPLIYSYTNPFRHPLFPDSVFYFTKHSSNAYEFGKTTPIEKIYPNQLPPSVPPVASDYTDDGYLKYYEYTFELTSLLASVSYYMNVTAFDFGSPESGLEPLETAVTVGPIEGFPAGTMQEVTGEFTDVYVYPNPYRSDEDYRGRGFEGLSNSFLPDDKVRAINFANLPPKCTIRIFSLDGDLIRELIHDVPDQDPTSSHARWDLITRNKQIVVSGLYYWSVEFPDGSTQIGKIAIIM